jgi:hypothetical protein
MSVARDPRRKCLKDRGGMQVRNDFLAILKRFDPLF